MKSRIHELVDNNLKGITIGTFHSIGQRMVRMHGEPLGFQSNYTILDQSDAESLMADVIRGLDPLFLKDKNNPKAKVIANAISLSRNTCQSIEDSVSQFSPYFHEYIPDFERFFETYTQRKQQQQVADYDDLLVLWLEILKTQESVASYYQERFQHILVDDYQDTNIIQAEIIDRIGRRNQIMAKVSIRGVERITKTSCTFRKTTKERNFIASKRTTAAPQKYCLLPTTSLINSTPGMDSSKN